MTEAVRGLIARDDRETLRRWMPEGGTSAVPEAEKAEWTRLDAEGEGRGKFEAYEEEMIHV